MSLVLRDCQTKVITETRAALRVNRNVLIQAATGFGKTIISAFMSGSANDKGKRLYFICHRAELIYQTHLTFNKVGIQHGFIAAGFTPDYSQRIQICSIDTFKRRLKDIPEPDLCIWDECFPAGTLIDNKKIEDIKSGDMLWSYNHDSDIIEKKKVKRLFKSKPKQMVRVKLSNGKSINCTAGHPFYVHGSGYVPAVKLKGSDYVSKFQLPLVREISRGSDKKPERQASRKREGVLQKGMRLCLQGKAIIRDNDSNKQEIQKTIFRQNEEKQSNEKRKVIGENESDIKANRSQTASSWWKWCINGSSSKNITGCIIKFRSKIRTSYKNRIKATSEFTKSLQNRYCFAGFHDSHRGGRCKSLIKKEKAIRFEKRQIPEFIRVESVEIQEPDSSGGFGKLCEDGYVYNIEIEDNNNYFVDGVLVHNCHHLGAKGWSDVHDYYDKAFHIGLSATPHRLDGKGLGQWFDHMVCGPSISWLIENKYLSDYRLISTPVEPDLSSIKTRMGDYKKDELNEAVDKADIIGDIVRHYLKYARGKKAIMFAVSVKHSLHLVEQFRANGIMAVHLDGKTPKDERKKASRAFAEGHIQVLSNVGLFGEGYDLAAQSGMDVNIECVIDAAPTQSLSLCLQRWGRALRQKDYPAIILDHAGNWKRHGLPDEDREWSLEGSKGQGKKKDDEDSVTVKQCPKCYEVHFPAKFCPNCGHEYKVVGREIEVGDGELVEIDKDTIRKEARKEQGSAESLEALIELGRQRNYKNPIKWAAHIYTSREEKKKKKYGYWHNLLLDVENKNQIQQIVNMLEEFNNQHKFMKEHDWVSLTKIIGNQIEAFTI